MFRPRAHQTCLDGPSQAFCVAGSCCNHNFRALFGTRQTVWSSVFIYFLLSLVQHRVELQDSSAFVVDVRTCFGALGGTSHGVARYYAMRCNSPQASATVVSLLEMIV